METEKPNTDPKREIAQTDKQGGESQEKPAAPPPISEPVHSETKGREAEEPKEQVDRKQNEELASIAAQTKWMEQQTGWMAQQTKFIRRQFWAALALGVLTFLVLFYQAWTMGGQLESMNSSSNQTQDMIRATQRLANSSENTAAQYKDIAESTKKQADASTIQANVSQGVAEQNKELVRHAGEQARASAIQANASQLQARTSGEIVKQNERLVRSGEEQATALREQAGIALKQFEITDRPWLDVEAVPNGPLEFRDDAANLTVRFTVKNVGRSVALRATLTARVFVPTKAAGFFDDAVAQQRKICSEVNSNIMAFALFPNNTLTLDSGFSVATQVLRSTHLGPYGFASFLIVGCADYQINGQTAHHQTGFIYEVYKGDPVYPNAYIVPRIGEDVPPDLLRIRKPFLINGDYVN
ncbi:MAG TPA: hypothetical protein VGC87_03445 [Pyrinomonadaceae bacterium]|jgi:hypothetical protein